MPDPTAPESATPVKSPRSGIVSHSGFRLGLLALLCLNNILEQDQRAIKRRVTAKQGFREFHAARRTIQGYEAMHMIRKGRRGG